MKQKRVAFYFAIAIVLFLMNGCCNPELGGNVPNTLRTQETNNWCWAATTQMLAQHLGIGVNQCDLANHRFGKTNCCNPQTEGASCPKTNDCNLSWQNLREQIFCSKRPMGYAYGTPGVVGHVLVIKGYITLGGTNYLILNDPWSPCMGQERTITYEQYADPAGTSTHWSTFYNIAKK
jgi:hypothetical protein